MKTNFRIVFGFVGVFAAMGSGFEVYFVLEFPKVSLLVSTTSRSKPPK